MSSKIIQKLKVLILTILRGCGYELCRTSKSPTLKSALTRVSLQNIQVNSVIDIGASDGRWSLTAKPFFPEAHYLLVEANAIHANQLEQLIQKDKKFDYVLSAAGNSIGEIYFDDGNPFGGLASSEPFADKCSIVPVTTVDRLAVLHQLTPPFLLKLDTHGFERQIFEGGSEGYQPNFCGGL